MPAHIHDFAAHLELRIPKGDSRTILFQLRKLNERGVQDVSTADSFEFRWKSALDGLVYIAYPSPTHPSANWANGDVPVNVHSSMTATVGTVTFSLVAIFGTAPKTICTGKYDVYDHP
jgi:hypothetical protein